MADPNFQKKPKPPTTAPRVPAANQQPYFHNHPVLAKGTLKVGGVVRIATDAEQKALGSLGLLDGGDLPKNIAELIEKALKENPGLYEDKVDLPADHKVNPRTETDIERLPPEKKAEIKAFVEEYRKQRELEERTAAAMIPGAAPGVNEALANAIRTEAGRAIPFEMEDSPPPPASSEVRAEAPEPGTTPTSNEAGGVAPLSHCPVCQHDLSVLEVVKVEKEDVLGYFASMLAQERFTKVIPLFDGRIKVCYQDLESDEYDLCVQQVMKEVRKDPSEFGYLDPVAAESRRNEYIFALSIKWIHIQGKDKLVVPELARWSEYAGDCGAVQKRYRWVIENLMAKGSSRRLFFWGWEKFRIALNSIEQRAFDPNFENEIAKLSS